MHGTRRKLIPVGSNMNDAAYPFRGEHRLDDCINHGHSGVKRIAPSSLSLQISGSNLTIEKLQPSKDTELSCELGIDGGITRPITLEQPSAFAVPGDGHNYNLIAAVKVAGSNAKHYCRLTFNGAEGTTVMRIRAPEGYGPDTVYLVADGRRLRPTAGWFRVPLQTKECALVVNSLMEGFAGHPLAFPASPPKGRRTPLKSSPKRVSRAPSPSDETILLETAPVPPDWPTQQATLLCLGTGGVLALPPRGTVAVPLCGAPYRLHLPLTATSEPPTADGAAGVTGAAIPEVETHLQPGSAADPASLPSFVASAPSFHVKLIAEDGAMAAGVATAVLPLSHRRAQRIQLIISSSGNHAVVMRQSIHLPALQAPPAAIQLREDEQGGLSIQANTGSQIVLNGVRYPATTTPVPLVRGLPQQIVVEQSNADGTVSAAALDMTMRSGTGAAGGVPGGGMAAPTTTAAGAAAPAGGHSAGGPEPWVLQLCEAIQKPKIEDARRLAQAIQPSHLPGMTIVNYVKEQLGRVPPTIGFNISRNGLEALQCSGCTVTAVVGTQPPRMIPTYGSVQLTPGTAVTLTATSTSNQRPVSSCRVQMSQSMQGAVGQPQAGSGGTDGAADSDLVRRLVDSVLRSNMNAASMANDLSTMPTVSFSSQGKRLVPLLINCLRSSATAAGKPAGAVSKPDELFCTCGAGYVENIYTSKLHYHLFAKIDNQPEQQVDQRGRVPASGVLVGDKKPYFLHLIAKDPSNGEVKVEKSLTILGVAEGPPPTAGQQPLSTAAPVAEAAGPAAEAAALPLSTSSSAAAPTPPLAQEAAAGSRNSGNGAAVIPFIDVSLQTIGQDVQARIICPPHLRIICDIDGIGGDTARSDFVTRMLASRYHQIQLSLVDAYGKVVVQQKLDLPAMSSSLWGLAVQHNGLSVDPDGGSVVTASIDRSPERTLQGNYVSFDASIPHFVFLRKYLNGMHGSCIGEVALRLPGLSLPPELAELSRILRMRANRQLSDGQARQELLQLRVRCQSPPVSDIISSLLDVWDTPSAVVPRGAIGESDSSRIFFRLTGAD